MFRQNTIFHVYFLCLTEYIISILSLNMKNNKTPFRIYIKFFVPLVVVPHMLLTLTTIHRPQFAQLTITFTLKFTRINTRTNIQLILSELVEKRLSVGFREIKFHFTLLPASFIIYLIYLSV